MTQRRAGATHDRMTGAGTWLWPVVPGSHHDGPPHTHTDGGRELRRMVAARRQQSGLTLSRPQLWATVICGSIKAERPDG